MKNMKEMVEKLKKYTKNLKVLYVEDDALIQEQTKDFLHHFFDQIDLAPHGQAGLELYQQNSGRYDIVISDINMPEMNGIDMCAKMRELNEDQMIIITSAYNESGYFIRLIDIGVDKFVMKPFDHQLFIKTLTAITKTVYTRKRESQLEKQLKNQAAETFMILDMIDSAIAVFENDHIIRANSRFLELTGYDDMASLIRDDFQFPSIMQNKSGYLKADNNHSLLQTLQTEKSDKARLRIGEAERIYLLHLKPIPDSNKSVLSMDDVSDIEFHLSQDEITKLSNHSFITKQIHDLCTAGTSFSLVIFTIKNMNMILKWHGKEAGIEAEQRIGQLLLEMADKLGQSEKVFAGYMGRNRFILLAYGKIALNKAVKMVKEIGCAASQHETNTQTEHDFITFHPNYLVIETKDKTAKEIFTLIEQGFDSLDY